MSSVGDLLQTAMRLHQMGQLNEADRLYRQILQFDPRNADALHLLGLVAHQTGRSELAVQMMTDAIGIEGAQPIYHNNLGEAYRTLGRTAEAHASYLRAIWFDPAFAAAHYNLGLLLSASQPADARRHYEEAVRLQPGLAVAHNNLGNVLRVLGKPAEAIEAYRRAIACRPDYADAMGNLGAVLVELERYPEAIEQLEHAARLLPDAAAVHFNLGNAHKAAQEWEAAQRCYEEALRWQPEFDEARCNLANALRIRGETDRAKAEYQKVLARDPDHVEAVVGYGALLQGLGQLDEALTYYDRAVKAKPNSALAHYYRANVLMYHFMRNDAIAAFAEALRLQPNYPQAYANLAIIYNEAGQPDAAIDCCQRGFDLGSTNASLFGSMAVALQAQGRSAEAIAYYRKSIELRPDSPAEHSNLLYALNFMPENDSVTLFQEHLEWAKRHAEKLTAAVAPHENDRTPSRRLRIGYVSPHFREHATNFFIEPILAHHDHERFEVFCYSSTLTPDAITARLRTMADHWREVTCDGDERVAEMIRADRIDILIDLSGHMGWTRLIVFARKPAPVQVTYLGYQNTSGMSAMDYRLTDSRADPPGLTERFHTEQLVRLPRAFFCYQPFETPSVTASPAIASGHVTFGSFNNFAKVMPAAIDAWLEILSRVPSSRLLVLAYKGGYLERHLHALAARRGIEPERIELCDKCSHDDYMRLLARADIGLDPFPFTGHTTTCDCAWMGVPVVMLEGDSYLSRFGGTVLANVGLEGLIASSVPQYVDLAVDLANRPEDLAELRGGLRERMAASPLLDYQGFTRNLEAAYRKMWTDWCRAPETN
jgi:protein O-GlcNAc transferase